MYRTKLGIGVPMVQNFCWIHLMQRAAGQRAAFCLLTASVEDLPGPITLAVVHVLIIISLLVLCSTDSDVQTSTKYNESAIF